MLSFESLHTLLMGGLASMMFIWVFIYPAGSPPADSWKITPFDTLRKFVRRPYLHHSRRLPLTPVRAAAPTPPPPPPPPSQGDKPLIRMLHIMPSGIWSACYLLQRSKRIRKRLPKLHRVTGRVFFLCSAAIASGWALLESRGLANEHHGEWSAVDDRDAVTVLRAILHDLPCASDRRRPFFASLIGPCTPRGEPSSWPLALISALLILAPLFAVLCAESLVGWRRVATHFARGASSDNVEDALAVPSWRPWNAALMWAAMYPVIVLSSESSAALTIAKGSVMTWCVHKSIERV